MLYFFSFPMKKITFSTAARPYLWGSWIEQTYSTLAENAHSFNNFFLYLFPPHCTRDHDVNKIDLYTLLEDISTQVLVLLAKWFTMYITTICKYFFSQFLSKISPHCGPILPPGIMVWTHLSLQYTNMFPHKFQLFCHNGFKDF